MTGAAGASHAATLADSGVGHTSTHRRTVIRLVSMFQHGVHHEALVVIPLGSQVVNESIDFVATAPGLPGSGASTSTAVGRSTVDRFLAISSTPPS
jgi:hypothetical protein